MANIFSPPLPVNNRANCYWQKPIGCGRNLAVSNAATIANGPILLVCEDNESVEQSIQELRYFSLKKDFEVFSLPDWETLPYDNFSPHQDIISERLTALYHLPQLNRGILVVSITSLMHRLPPRQYISANSLNMQVGQKLSIEQIREQMVLAGYQAVETVFEHGEFAVRGSIIDIYPMGSRLPFRIDLFDDQIDSLRKFDPETQRSDEQVDEINLLPGREYPLNENGIAAFRNAFHESFDIDFRQCPIYQDVSSGLNSPGLEYYLAVFFDNLNSLFDFLPATTIIYQEGNLKQAGERFWDDINSRYEERQIDRFRPVLDPNAIFVRVDEILSNLKKYPQIEAKDHAAAFDLGTIALPDLTSDTRLNKPFTAVQEFIGNNKARVLFCAESAGRKETLLETLGHIGIKPKSIYHWEDFLTGKHPLSITIAPLEQGLWLPDDNILLISENQLFGNRVAQRRRRRKSQSNTDLIVRNLTELEINDAVVHLDHGVGRYRGLQTIVTEGQTTEFLTVEYADSAKLYVPVASLDLISRYSGADQESTPLNHLGTTQWQKTKRKAAEKIHDIAVELLDIYARRQSKKGFKYKIENEQYNKFSGSFPFEETADQENTIEAVLEDMQSKRTMDRLVCGDVGFGKTEVAMRAAFVAVQNYKQVVVLVPTTLLAQQHVQSFKDRFAEWPVIIDVISRFKSTSEQRKSVQKVIDGKVDILIGTHKLLHVDIDFHNLGLLIIDEEHRFGVRQKEKLKSLRADIDILTLTATPIPRTLNMALSSIRDLSIIATPPAKRLSVKTFVREQQDSLKREAVSRELLRGGQIFYIHNEVKSIERAAQQLQEIIPQARICVAHGQMAERDLEKVMADFYHKRYNVLVCTTIIETGIDIPSANTILINRADKLGLAQLHQLRGRVGRSHHQAYAYLLLPSHSRMSRDAKKRVEAIQAATTLGAGFTLASHDLEIRGAGELLGDEQSGHMQKIGFSLYTEMLEEAVSTIKAGKKTTHEMQMGKNIEITLRIPALIPDTYLPDVHMRLIMYKRISSSRDSFELEDLQIEMIDRFGLFPEPLSLLFRLTRLKLKAQIFDIKKIDANSNNGKIEFLSKTQLDPLSLVQLIQETPQSYKLIGANQLQFHHGCEQATAKLDFIDELLDKFRLVKQKMT